jgi:uncharacterized protein (UPF0262 family)
MPLETAALDERTLERGSEAQREEWDASIRELLSVASCEIDEAASLSVSAEEEHFVLDFAAVEGDAIATVRIPHELLAEHITEYLDIVQQITTADSLNQVEALDMAKKVTHDRAGRVLKKQLRELGFDLETSRRLFTLLLSLKVDTTRLPGLRAHRRAG